MIDLLITGMGLCSQTRTGPGLQDKLCSHGLDLVNDIGTDGVIKLLKSKTRVLGKRSTKKYNLSKSFTYMHRCWDGFRT